MIKRIRIRNFRSLVDVDQRADIYSLGAILYEILTLTPPVGRGGDMMAILMRVVEGQIDPPEKLAPKRWMPAELSAVAMKALAKDPGKRYQTVESLQQDIQLYQEGRSVSAKQDTFREQAWKLVKRYKGASTATAAALVVPVRQRRPARAGDSQVIRQSFAFWNFARFNSCRKSSRQICRLSQVQSQRMM